MLKSIRTVCFFIVPPVSPKSTHRWCYNTCRIINYNCFYKVILQITSCQVTNITVLNDFSHLKIELVCCTGKSLLGSVPTILGKQRKVQGDKKVGKSYTANHNCKHLDPRVFKVHKNNSANFHFFIS
jgi:hypothetical protein